MTAVVDLGTGRYADTTSPSRTIVDAKSDVEIGEQQQGQPQFGDQSSRLPTAKIITVSTVDPSTREWERENYFREQRSAMKLRC